MDVDFTSRGSASVSCEPAVSSSSSNTIDEAEFEEEELVEPPDEDEDEETVGEAGRWRELLDDIR